MADGQNPCIALIDAAIVYGANRWLKGLHEQPDWLLKDNYLRADDHRLFLEFLHLLMLFDGLVLDDSSMSMIGSEIREMMALVNVRAKDTRFFTSQKIGKSISVSSIAEAVCELIQSILNQGIRDRDVLGRVPVPWAYKEANHVDREAFLRAAGDVGLDTALVPLAIFAYRGLVYAGIAHDQLSSGSHNLTTYVAAPGRLRALEQLLSSKEISKIAYPARGYGALLNELPLPRRGYDFSFLSSIPAPRRSALTSEIDARTPRAALRWVLDLRLTSEAASVRTIWRKLLNGIEGSKIVGSEFSQSVTHSQIAGDLIQNIYVGTAME